ncbi:MFS transporter [Bifidobacterium tissieri]|uniref:MFS transporter n=1 Tax=Bifidobacterium tissieri TaxID=1630162 RepID=A0A261FCN5_9BIFI|nr:MFS transporter [Bifidobacterium tissieri]OZG56910.1 MFS transporter [Bifidobacterium tissieri]
MLAGAALIVGFVAWDHHASNPLMKLSLMRNPSFAANVPALLMLNFSMYGIIFIMSAYLETVTSHGAFVGGLLPMPLVVASIVGSLCNGQATSWIGYRGASLLSLIMLAAGMAAMGGGAFLGDTVVGWILLITGQAVAGLGLSAGQPAILTWAMSTMPAEHSGSGSSLLTVFRQFGSIIGAGIFGSISGGMYATRFQSDASAAAAGMNPGHLTSAGSVNLDFQQAQRLTEQAAETLRTVAAKAYESSMLASFLIAALVIAITTTAVAAISRKHNLHD